MESITYKKYKKVNGVVVEDVEQRFVNGELVYNKSKTKSLKKPKECCGECHKDDIITTKEDLPPKHIVEKALKNNSDDSLRQQTDMMVHELLSETDEEFIDTIEFIIDNDELLTVFKAIHPKVLNDLINKVISLDIRLGDKLKKAVYDDPQARKTYLNNVKENQNISQYEEIVTAIEDYIANNNTIAGFKGHTDQSIQELIKEVVDVDPNVDVLYMPTLYLKFNDGDVERYDILPNNPIYLNEYKKLFIK